MKFATQISPLLNWLFMLIYPMYLTYLLFMIFDNNMLIYFTHHINQNVWRYPLNHLWNEPDSFLVTIPEMPVGLPSLSRRSHLLPFHQSSSLSSFGALFLILYALFLRKEMFLRVDLTSQIKEVARPGFIPLTFGVDKFLHWLFDQCSYEVPKN